jgi:hypothetical protein
MPKLNETKLRSLAASSPAAHAVFQEFASRLRPRDVIDIKRLKARLIEKNFHVRGDDLERVFTSLQQMGYGKYTEARRGTGNRPSLNPKFHLDVPMMDLTAAALGEDEMEKLRSSSEASYFSSKIQEKTGIPMIPSVQGAGHSSPVTHIPHAENGNVLHTFRLFPSKRKARIEAPADLNDDEARDLVEQLIEAYPHLSRVIRIA